MIGDKFDDYFNYFEALLLIRVEVPSILENINARIQQTSPKIPNQNMKMNK
jgi:hypothetical protein